ncbi:MAG: hypothetical protein M3Q70_01450 [bacterium]|nr:hypothetical protein [bacterium]
MITANIYSRAELLPTERDPLIHGLEILGASVGGVALQDFIVTKQLSRDKRRGLNLSNIAVEEFNPTVDMHIFIAPYFRKNYSKVQGFARLGDGTTFLNGNMHSTPKNKSTLLLHESAHALGYEHCNSGDCVMTPFSPNTLTIEELMKMFETETPEDVYRYHVDGPDSFCTDCEQHIKQTIDNNVDDLRNARLAFGIRL